MSRLNIIAENIRDTQAEFDAARGELMSFLGELVGLAIAQAEDLHDVMKAEPAGGLAAWLQSQVPALPVEQAERFLDFRKGSHSELFLAESFTTDYSAKSGGHSKAKRFVQCGKQEPIAWQREAERIKPNARERVWGSIFKLRKMIDRADLKTWTHHDLQLTRSELAPAVKVFWPNFIQ